MQLRKNLFIFISLSHVTNNSDPDKNPAPDATARFQAVGKAYKVLSDPKLRSTYDLLGSHGQKISTIFILECIYFL